jgi:multiple sugar transport system ATP-binding protein
MNLWPCRVIGGDGGIRLESPVAAIEVPAGALEAVHGREGFVGVRPHDIEIVSEEQGDTAAVVEIVEPLGALTLIHVAIEAVPNELLRIVVPAEARVAVGDRVSLRLRRDRLHVFDRDSGKRLN